MKSALRRWIPGIIVIVFCLYMSRRAVKLLKMEQCLLWIIIALSVALIELVVGIYKNIEQEQE